MSEEIWKPIPGWEDRYEVSDHGRVRSLWAQNNKRAVPKILSGSVGPNGYPYVALSKGYNTKKHYIHRLVLQTFVGAAPVGHECAHQDGDRKNPKLENLRWMTAKDNSGQKYDHGTHLHGELAPWSKLTEKQVRLVLRMQTLGVTNGSIQKYYGPRWGVGPTAISQVQRGITWKHISKEYRL